MKKHESYRTAIYLRLSKEDGTGESGSIQNQRALLTAYARQNGLTILAEYCDDGWSGTNFDRPSFRRMMADVESGKINCILTKDLSRLGRNGARTADLLDEFFPTYGVRYIAVLDGYDSHALARGTALTASVMSVINELYARDISEKIRSSLHTKMEQGAFIGSFAPYGYQKDPQNKNRLLPDPRAAAVVRKIFHCTAEGKTPGEIATILNEAKIATPAVYRSSGHLCSCGEHTARWDSSMICKLLARRVYCGDCVQGKTEKVSFKNKTCRRKSPEAWITVEHTHEPIVSDELFQLARNRCAARRCEPHRGFQNAFAGLIFCADCGRAMTTVVSRKKASIANLCCGGYKARGTSACSGHLIDYDHLCKTIEAEIKAALLEHSKLLSELILCFQQQTSKNDVVSYTAFQRRKAELLHLEKRLYEDYALGKLDETLFLELSSAYRLERNYLETDFQNRETCNTHLSLCMDRFASYLLQPSVLHTLIARIEVGQGVSCVDAHSSRYKEQTITIWYRFPRVP